MTSLLNQYSVIFISLIVLIAVGFIMRRLLHVRWIVTATAVVGVAVFLTLGWLALRPGDSDVNTIQEAEWLLTNGKPTFLEFFSNYCAGCVAARPAVDALVSQIGADYNVLRVDIHSDFGRELRERYSFSYTPEFVIFDPTGQEVWRAHTPPSSDQLAAAVPTQVNVP